MSFIVGTWNPYTWQTPWPYQTAAHAFVYERYSVSEICKHE